MRFLSSAWVFWSWCFTRFEQHLQIFSDMRLIRSSSSDHGHKHFSVLSHRRGTKSACKRCVSSRKTTLNVFDESYDTDQICSRVFDLIVWSHNAADMRMMLCVFVKFWNQWSVLHRQSWQWGRGQVSVTFHILTCECT